MVSRFVLLDCEQNELTVPGFCGFMSVLSSIQYCQKDHSDLTHLWLAFGFMPFGLLFDLFDGKVARWRQKSSLMGQELDSLADLVGTRVANPSVDADMLCRSHSESLLLWLDLQSASTPYSTNSYSASTSFAVSLD